MASQTGKWREDQILIICPGSQTTMAQLGCGELTPPAFRIPTRMFKDDETDGWRPYYTYKRNKAGQKISRHSNGVRGSEDAHKKDEDEYEYVEDPDSTEGAVFPLQGGRIVNMDAFLAFLDHVHGTLTTTYHNTPIMLMASPQWTRPDCETIARYVFEKTKTPALCLIHSGVATQYGLKWPNMTVVDIGFEKVDVTCIYDNRVVNHNALGYPGPDRAISGGEVFTRKLLKLLSSKGFTYEMAEQLKKSNICEVLPYVPESAALMDLPADAGHPGVSATVSASVGFSDGPRIIEPSRQPAGLEADDDGTNGGEKAIDEDGVLDVANIVASGQTREFLAKKEKEKAEKAKSRKAAKDKEADAAAAKPTRLPNSKRTRNIFHYEEVVMEEVAPPPPKENGTKDQEMTDALPTTGTPAVPSGDGHASTANGDVPKTESDAVEQPANGTAPDADGAKPEAPGAASVSGAPAAPTPAPPVPESSAPERQARRVRRDVEVGLERFTFADRAEIDRIVTTIYRTVQGIEDMYMRPQCWENIVFVGNGARVRGLKDNIMQTLNARHLVSPSTATMFTSELPSNLATPSGTGSQTPTGSFTGAPHLLPTSSSVNPLLQAATTASLVVPGGGLGGTVSGTAGSNAGEPAPSHHFHSQTPTAIKLSPLPNYLSEWTKNGFEEAMFLGAQVAARLAFCVHNMDTQGLEAQRLMSLNRVDYNDLGPKGIRTHSMLG